jgi:guanine deaminase
MQRRIVRGPVLQVEADPGLDGSAGGWHFEPDAAILIEDGRIGRIAPAEAVLRSAPAGPGVAAAAALAPDGWPPVEHWPDHLIVPGFVDLHLHFPQVDVIASHGAQLLDWLDRYTFPQEQRFADRSHGDAVAPFFCDRLVDNGVTTAMVFGTVHPESVDAVCAEALRRNLRLIAGKSAMDRHCPPALRDTPQRAYDEALALIERWHGRGRLGYAITPRFAPASTEAQLRACQRLAAEHPDVWIQSHVAENRDEVAWAMQLFPGHRSYLSIYDAFGLLRERSVYAHCIWLDDADRRLLADRGAAAAFCPTSNLFIGSGLYDLDAAGRAGHRLGLGTDVGAGTSYSMLQTLADAYKVTQLRGHALHPAYGLYLATLGGAKALGLEAQVGSLAAGKDADLVVLDPAATPVLARRTARAGPWQHDPIDTFFALMMLGDDRAVEQTYVAGVPALVSGR